MKPVILDTGPCLNLISINQGNLMHAALSVDYDRLLVPREVTLVIDDGGGQALAKEHGFATIGTIRILALAAFNGLVNRAEMKTIYERLRPSGGAEPMDNGLPHWTNSGLDNRRLYKRV